MIHNNLEEKTMNILYFLASIIIFLLIGGCSGGSDDDNSGDRALTTNACGQLDLNTRVINGTACQEQGSPIVRLQIVYSSGKLGLCSGTMISSNAVLTAAHCFFERVSSTAVLVDGNSAFATEIILHPQVSVDFNNLTVINDSAIVRLSRSLPTRTLPILLSRSPNRGEIISVFGYGLDENNRSEILRSGEMRISDVNSNHVSASFNGEGSNPCNGDSGGPAILTFIDQNNREVDAIAGVVSSGTEENCQQGDVTLFTNTQSSSQIDFILRNVPQADVR